MKLTKRQKSQLFSALLLIVIAGIIFFSGAPKEGTTQGYNGNLNKQIYYTKHAKCRMDCRHISKEEIDFVRKNGNINYRKSDMDDQPCPTISKEARSKDGQMIRVVFAECATETKVITAIDLENKYTCNCK